MAGMKVFRERGESISGNVNSARRNFHSTSTEDGKGLGLGAYTQFFDLTDELADCDAFTVGGDISYGFGNVTYALNLEYGNEIKDDKDQYFAITPSVAIVF